jgi:type IV pilus assembly protein PilC
MYYQYLVYTEDKRVEKGVQVAENADIATRILMGQGYKILSLKPTSDFLGGQRDIFQFFNKVSAEALVTFSRQFALLHESGSDIVSTLVLLRSHNRNRMLKKVIGDIISDLNKGSALSDAMAKHPRVFSKIYVQSIKVGEQSGNLENVLRQMADFLEREVKSSKNIKDAMRYPIIISVVAFIVIVILVTYVLPAFMEIYNSLNVKLPGPTQFLLSIAGWFSHYGLFLLGSIVIAGIVFIMWNRTEEGKYQWARLMLKLPYLGRINLLNELSRCCRSISILYKAGLQVPDILKMAIDTSANLVVKQALTDVYKDVVKGEGLSRPMKENPVFLDMMVQMVGVGETTGSLDKTLMATAETYETEAEERMRAFVGMIQPAITVGIGLVVAFVAISLISAMYSMYGQIG